MRSDCIIDGLGYTTLDPQAFETALRDLTRVSGGTGCVSYSQTTFTMVRIGRRSWKELEHTVAAAVESSGVAYLHPVVSFIPCDYYRSGDDECSPEKPNQIAF